MKAAFCTGSFSTEEMPEVLKLLKDMGYHGVEFWNQYLIETDIVQLKGLVDEIGLEVAQICPYFNVTGTEKELLDTYEIAERYINYAEILNCKLIRVFTGNVNSSQVDEKKYKQAIEGLKNICEMGREKNIFFVLETHDGSLMDTSAATLKLLNDVDCDNLKVNLQIPLGYGREDIFESARLLGEHVIHLHAHNWIGNWPNLTYLGEGDYDFKKFVDILRKKGFDGYISIEHGDHMGKRNPFEVAKKEIEYINSKIL